MKTWTSTVDCICGKKHSFYTDSEEKPSGNYGYRCRSMQVKMDAGKQAWSESAQVPKGAKKVVTH
jgi:hypothetical protein